MNLIKRIKNPPCINIAEDINYNSNCDSDKIRKRLLFCKKFRKKSQVI